MKKLLSFCAAFVLALGALFSDLPGSVAKADTDEALNIQPLVWYQFDDPSNPGKDSMGNFDLKSLNTYDSQAIQVVEEDGKNYLKLTSQRDAQGYGGKAGGALYAPQLDQSGKDFSDLIRYSYSVEITFRRDNSSWIGDHYLLAVGQYNNAFQITPWKGGIEIQVRNFADAPGDTDQERQQFMEENTLFVKKDTSQWTTLLVSADYATKKINVYIDGELVLTETVNNVKFTYPEEPYTFTLGAQCQYNGSAATQFATVDILDCKVYDVALTGENAQELYEGMQATYKGQKYIKSVASIDTTQLNLNVTDVNTLDNILNNVLPKKVDVTLNDDTTLKVDVVWSSSGDKLRGYIQSQIANINGYFLEAEYGYTVDFQYDPDLVTVTGIKLDNQAFTPGTKIDGEVHTVSFKVTPKEHVDLKSVIWFDMEQDGENGEYQVTFSGGACIIIEAEKTPYTITYKFGDETLGTSTYTYNGSEGLREFTKDGYKFEGWYIDADLTQAFTELDYENPQNITLYAKFIKDASAGANVGLIVGIVIGAGALIAGAGAAVYFLVIKKKN
ncbi:MAG TPA: InlB B-repeat-containing protein [Clostridia bacterium]